LINKLQGKRRLGRIKLRLGNNIKKDVKKSLLGRGLNWPGWGNCPVSGPFGWTWSDEYFGSTNGKEFTD
jgi:hypothetical protein